MSDVVAVLLILYVQLGLVLGWYLFFRRVLAVRDDFAARFSARETSWKGLESEVAELRRLVRDLTGRKPREPLQRESQAFKQAKRRGALEMARRGMDLSHIAETLNMRRAEVEMLVRMDRLQRGAQPAGQTDNRSWLELPS